MGYADTRLARVAKATRVPLWARGIVLLLGSLELLLLLLVLLRGDLVLLLVLLLGLLLVLLLGRHLLLGRATILLLLVLLSGRTGRVVGLGSLSVCQVRLRPARTVLLRGAVLIGVAVGCRGWLARGGPHDAKAALARLPLPPVVELDANVVPAALRIVAVA